MENAVLWLDHAKAHVIRFNRNDSEATLCHAKERHPHLHHHANSIGDGRAHIDQAFFSDVANALADTKTLLVTGPGLAKTEFVQMLREHKPVLANAVAAVETMDHPSEPELLAYARKHIRALARMKG